MTLAETIRTGDPDAVASLIAAGADIRYRNKGGYDALIDAVHGRNVLRDPRLLELLELLVSHGVELSGVTKYRESGLRVLSRLGRFDAVNYLLKAGADPSHLEWTPLIRAVALGSLDEVKSLVREGAHLEEKDYWERTPWLVAIQTGDLEKARFLRESGADLAATGRCGKPALFYAIENHHPSMISWLLEIGLDPKQTDEFGTAILAVAAEHDDLDCIEILLRAGVAVDSPGSDAPPLAMAESREAALLLLAAGADPAGLSGRGRRLLAGLPPDPSKAPLREVSREEFLRAQTRRFGKSNPEEIREPFWEAMVRSGVSAYSARQLFEESPSCPAGEPACPAGRPVWCAERFGQSITLLPDGRAVLIGGEHEDWYDPDFCIYNEVIVLEPDGAIRIFGYPESVFPPTDFHTATWIGGAIYIIGCLGYPQDRGSKTPVFRLDIDTFRIERLSPEGESPGWIHRHRAERVSDDEILVSGGSVEIPSGGKSVLASNDRRWILDLRRMSWRAA